MPLSALPSPHPSIVYPKMENEGAKERCHRTEEVPEGAKDGRRGGRRGPQMKDYNRESGTVS